MAMPLSTLGMTSSWSLLTPQDRGGFYVVLLWDTALGGQTLIKSLPLKLSIQTAPSTSRMMLHHILLQGTSVYENTIISSTVADSSSVCKIKHTETENRKCLW